MAGTESGVWMRKDSLPKKGSKIRNMSFGVTIDLDEEGEDDQ